MTQTETAIKEEFDVIRQFMQKGNDIESCAIVLNNLIQDQDLASTEFGCRRIFKEVDFFVKQVEELKRLRDIVEENADWMN
jgi:hypothetical protein